LTEVYDEDLITLNQKNIPENDDDEIKYEVILNTTKLLNETRLYLGRQTKGGVKAYVELVFQIYEKMGLGYLDQFNSAPGFRT
jgi:hypothetical protein